MEALKIILTWALAVCVAGAAVAVPCILAAPYVDDSFTYWLAVAVAAAVALLLVVAFHQTIFFYLRFVLKSLFRNLLRTGLTAAATMLLVFIVNPGLDGAVVPEPGDDREEQGPQGHRHRACGAIPSQMPFSYAAELADGAAR